MSTALPTTSLPAASLQVHEDLWEARGKIAEVLGWARLASIWLISLPIIYGLSLLLPHITIVGQLAFLDLYLGGFAFVVSAAWIVFRAWRAEQTMENWEERMLPFFYAVRFELLPIEGSDRELDIWRRYQTLFPQLADVGRKSWFSLSPTSLPILGQNLRFRADVKGKSGKRFFHIYALANDRLLLLVRRFESGAPVGRAELETLRQDAWDVARNIGANSDLVAAFSSGGFDEGAIEYVHSPDSRVGEVPIHLIRETPNGYTLVSVTETQRTPGENSGMNTAMN